MKLNRTLLFVLPLILCASLSRAQTVTTGPVGFVSNDFPANSDVTVSAPLCQAPVFTGVVGSVIDGDTIQLSATPVGDLLTNPHLAMFTSGDREGLFGLISAVNGDQIDLTFIVQNLGDTQGDQVEDGDSIELIPAWTLGGLLPDDGSVPNNTQVLLFNRDGDGINQGSQTFNYFSTFGWFQGANPANSQVIYPDESFVIRTTGGAFTHTVSGCVPMQAVRTVIRQTQASTARDIRMTSGVPVVTTFGELFPFDVNGVTDADRDGDSILLFDNSAAGINKGSQTFNFFSGFGWFRGANPANSQEIQPGQGFIYRKNAGNSAEVVISYRPTYQNQSQD